jgi:two-component system, NarL family, invasion response regulator UvrY
MEYKNVLLVDDHAITRLGLKELLLEFYPGLKIYESQDGESMLVTLKLHKIDTIVLDIQMSNSDTLSLVELVSIKYPDISVLIFSMLPERVYGRRMLKAGAKAPLLARSGGHLIWY